MAHHLAPGDPVELAGLLCSRMAHDLVGPSGAMANGLELLREETDPDGIQEIAAMLEKSAATLNARLQFYRLAFGMATALGEELEGRLLEKSLAQLLAHMRVTLSWAITAPLVAKQEARILLNLALVVAECLVRGGDLAIGDEHGRFTITGKGERIIIPDDIESLLKLPDAPVTPSPRNAPVLLALTVARARGRQVSLEELRPSGAYPPQDGGQGCLRVAIAPPEQA